MRLIDTDKLLEKTECLFKDLNSTEDYMGIGYNHGVGDSIAIIKNAPTIEAEPVKHGKWVKMSDADGYYYACSECGEELYREWIFDREFDLFPKKKTIDKTRYCPNCGAKMDGIEE